jgi:hypothetical protein
MAVLLCAVKKRGVTGQLRHVNAHPTLIVPSSTKTPANGYSVLRFPGKTLSSKSATGRRNERRQNRLFWTSASSVHLRRIGVSMFWFVVFGSFLGADVAQMKSTLMLGPFSAETECWEIGAATVERIIAIEPESEYRGACFKLADSEELSAQVAKSASMRDHLGNTRLHGGPE